MSATSGTLAPPLRRMRGSRSEDVRRAIAASRSAAVAVAGRYSTANAGLCEVTTTSESPMRRLSTRKPSMLMRSPAAADAGVLTSTRCTLTLLRIQAISAVGQPSQTSGGGIGVQCWLTTASARWSALRNMPSVETSMAPSAARLSCFSGVARPSLARR